MEMFTADMMYDVAEMLGAVSTEMHAACKKFDITELHRQCAFFAHCGLESDGFKLKREDLYYKPETLVRTFPRRFWLRSNTELICPPSKVSAFNYARSPEKLGNYLYANRNGNGNEASGDGFKYRGSPYIQLTGRANYDAFDRDCLRVTVKAGEEPPPSAVADPGLLLLPEFASLSSAWFWAKNGLNAFADIETYASFRHTREIVNGGTLGFDDHDPSDLDSCVDWLNRCRKIAGLKEIRQ